MAQSSEVLDDVTAAIRRLLGIGAGGAIPSAAPGGGPAAEREAAEDHPGRRVLGGGPIAFPATVRGGDPTGFGGHGDPVLLDDQPAAEVQHAIHEHVRLSQRRGLREPPPSGRIRFNIPFSPEAHVKEHTEDVLGAASYFDGTAAAPGAGTSVQTIPVSFPSAAVSPVIMLYRYPGALFFQLRISSFSWVPTATTMTGLQSLQFQDVSGATCPLGIYAASSQSIGSYVGIDKLLTGTYTDPGTITLGQLVVKNLGIGGTPVTVAWQLGICFEAMVADPWHNEQVIVPPMPAEIADARRSMEAAG